MIVMGLFFGCAANRTNGITCFSGVFEAVG
jgi:hypothetical protein